MPELEDPLVRIAIAADGGFLPSTVDFVQQTIRQIGLGDAEAGQLVRAVEAVCRNVIENAYRPEERGSYEVHVLRRSGQVVVAVEDQGLPLDYARFEEGGPGSESLPFHRFADEVRFINLGRGGNRVELIKQLPQTDVRDQLPEEEHHRTARAPAAAEDTPLEIRMMRPEEAVFLSRCVYRSYGYSYDWEDIYYPDRIQKLQESGLMRSCVAVTAEDEFVGHLAMRFEHPDSPIAEAGQAVVNPRFRGHHLFERMKAFLVEEARKGGIYGLYSEATAIHPYSQKGNLKLGARETGFLLGYIPPTVSYKQIADDRARSRGSVALFYTRANKEPGRTVYPPARYQGVVGRIVELNGLRRTMGEVQESQRAPSSRVSVQVRQDHNIAFLKVIEPGEDLEELVRGRLRELRLHRVDCVYADLPLSLPATQDDGERLSELGFFFGGVVPEGRDDGDVLRLQYLNNVEVSPEDVQSASDFGQELLGFIFAEKDARS
ncbi:MAG: GNAT family N-acetyltransferase [Rubrobacteraceae bacterium]